MTEKNKGGRPRKEINQEEFERLCGLQCTKKEICDWFDLTDKTLERRVKDQYGVGFSEIFEKKRVKGKISLRRNLLRMSETNASVAIFLAKNWLGMADKQEVSVDGAEDSSLNIKIEIEDAKKG